MAEATNTVAGPSGSTSPESSARIQQARKAGKQDPAKAEAIYREILASKPSGNTSALQEYETALIELGQILQSTNQVQQLAELVKSSTSSLTSFTKAKTAKLVRQLLDLFPSDRATVPIQISTTKACIEWAVSERRSFLRQSLEARLVTLYMAQQSFYDALGLINSLLKELKRLDDKLMLVEVQLLESRVYHALGNQTKSRAALTSARTSAASVYTPPLLQAGLDMQSGMLHAEDRDFNTAFSYFIEALEGFMALEDMGKATSALMYMLLCKIMLNLPDDVSTILSSKSVLKLSSSSNTAPAPPNTSATPTSKTATTATSTTKTPAATTVSASRNLEAMKAIARAHAQRSLQEYETALSSYRNELGSDAFIKRHLVRLYDAMLEQNLVKVIEPFSRVEISHIAHMLSLDTAQVERKLSQMILDKVISGVLDQGSACLIVFEADTKDQGYQAALETITKLSNVVDLLYVGQASLLE